GRTALSVDTKGLHRMFASKPVRECRAAVSGSLLARLRLRLRRLFYGFLLLLLFSLSGCGRFGHKAGSNEEQRIVCIGQALNEMIYALGAQASLVGVDYSSTYPPEIKKLPTVGYHRALSAEGILSLHPTMIIHDNNIGPDAVVRQLEDLKIPMKT